MATPPRYPADSGYQGPPDPSVLAGDYNVSEFMIRQIMAGLATATLAIVQGVSAGANGGTVDVQPLVSQVTGGGTPVAHGTVYGLPYVRLQAGTSAVILDPVVGDIGLVVFCSRDISVVKATGAVAAPGSRRQFDMADGIYLGGVLNGAPTRFVRMNAEGIQITDPTKITLTAPDVEINGRLLVKENAHFEKDVQIDGGVTNDGTGIGKLHTHTGVQSGGSNSGPVTP